MDFMTDTRHLMQQHGITTDVIDRIIGELRQRYGGERVFITKIDRLQRKTAIAADLSSGLPIEKVAQLRQCSPRTVHRIKTEWQL